MSRGTNHKRGNEAVGSVQNKVDVAHKKTVLDFVNYDPKKKPQAVTAKFGDSPVFFKYTKRGRKTWRKNLKTTMHHIRDLVHDNRTGRETFLWYSF